MSVSETKRQSAEWKSKDYVYRSPESRQCRSRSTIERGIHKKCVPEGRTINGEYYLQVVHRLWSRISCVRH